MKDFLKRSGLALVAVCLVLVPSCITDGSLLNSALTRAVPVVMTALLGGCGAALNSPPQMAPQQMGPSYNTPQQTAPVSVSNAATGGTATAAPSTNVNINSPLAPAGAAREAQPATRPAS
jgi:hypothetical protein